MLRSRSLPNNRFKIYILLYTIPLSLACPKVCECKWKEGKEWVTCSRGNFIDVPRGLDAASQVLDLTHNNLKILFKDAFIDTGLVNLQKLFLAHCNLQSMNRGSLAHLANLVELDVSFNKLIEIPSDALHAVPALRHLYLDRNSITSVLLNDFAYNNELIHIDLSYNKINIIHQYSFRTQIKLKILKISHNQITTLSPHIVKHLVDLYQINLDNNNWNCDCELGPTIQEILEQKITMKVTPKCSTPKHVAKRLWTRIQSKEFICAPKVSAVIPSVLAITGDNVSLSCKIQTEDKAKVMWIVGNKLLSNHSEDSEERYNIYELITTNKNFLMTVSNLTISNAGLNDQGIYRCIVQNKAGSVESNITLQISELIKDDPLVARDNSVVAGAIAGGVAACVVITTVICLLVHRKGCVRYDSKNRSSASSDIMQKKSYLQLSDIPGDKQYKVMPVAATPAVCICPKTLGRDNVNKKEKTCDELTFVVEKTHRHDTLPNFFCEPKTCQDKLLYDTILNTKLNTSSTLYCTLPRKQPKHLLLESQYASEDINKYLSKSFSSVDFASQGDGLNVIGSSSRLEASRELGSLCLAYPESDIEYELKASQLQKVVEEYARLKEELGRMQVSRTQQKKLSPPHLFRGNVTEAGSIATCQSRGCEESLVNETSSRRAEYVSKEPITISHISSNTLSQTDALAGQQQLRSITTTFQGHGHPSCAVSSSCCAVTEAPTPPFQFQ